MTIPKILSSSCCGRVVEDREDNNNMENMDGKQAVRALLFMVNSGSGVGKGQVLLEYVRGNPATFTNGVWHAIDLKRFTKSETIDEAAQELAQWIDMHDNARIAVAGGDGSVKWVISILSGLPLLKPVPPIAHMPVGTGNEMSRVTGWGIDNIWGTKRLNQYAELIFKGNVFDLDVWNVDIQDPEDEIKDKEDEEILSGKDSATPVVAKVGKHQKMIGFLTFGLDADFAAKYDRYRETKIAKGHPPTNIYKSRAVHGYWGAQKLVTRGPDVSTYFRLKCDGEEVQLPKGIQNLMFHNCHTSSGGTYYWGQGASTSKDIVKEPSPPSTCDGLMEVSCIRSMAHLTGSLLKLSHARRVAQAREMDLEFLKDISCQLDGEPWTQKAGSKLRITLDTESPKIRLIGGPGKSLNMGIRERDTNELLEQIPENEEIQIELPADINKNDSEAANNLRDNNCGSDNQIPVEA